jgi:hypothetical protein
MIRTAKSPGATLERTAPVMRNLPKLVLDQH